VVALAAVFAIVLSGLGLWGIVEGHHVGRTKQGVHVAIDGNPARWMGVVQICLGMLMLALAMPGKRSALVWSLSWVALGALGLGMALYAR
jgi:hypothetical protein